MTMTTAKTNSKQGVDLVITRIIDAPVELVWKAWSEPEQVKRWWGPQHYTSPTCTIDFQEGGKYIFCMRAPQDQGGRDEYSAGQYLKIVPFEILEFTQFMSDENGFKVNPVEMGLSPDFPDEVRTSVTFKRIRPDMTELSITEYGWTVNPMFVYALAGMHQSIDKLSTSLKSF